MNMLTDAEEQSWLQKNNSISPAADEINKAGGCKSPGFIYLYKNHMFRFERKHSATDRNEHQ
jgi:hypothetical protein